MITRKYLFCKKKKKNLQKFPFLVNVTPNKNIKLGIHIDFQGQTDILGSRGQVCLLNT